MIEHMRMGLKPRFISVDAKRTIAGVNLSSDYVLGHQLGIAPIKASFGLKEPGATDPTGLAPWTIKIFPQKKFFSGATDAFSFLMFDAAGEFAKKKAWNTKYFYLKTGQELVTAWSRDAFGILVAAEVSAVVVDLMRAFKKHDIALGLGVRSCLAPQDFIILMPSRVPKGSTQRFFQRETPAKRAGRGA